MAKTNPIDVKTKGIVQDPLEIKGKFYKLVESEGATAALVSDKKEGHYKVSSLNVLPASLPANDGRNRIVGISGAYIVESPDGSYNVRFQACRQNTKGFSLTGMETFELPLKWNNGQPYAADVDYDVSIYTIPRNLSIGLNDISWTKIDEHIKLMPIRDPYCFMTAELSQNAAGGLILYGSDSCSISIMRKDDNLILERNDQGDSEVLAVRKITDRPMTLKVLVAGDEGHFYYRREEDDDFRHFGETQNLAEFASTAQNDYRAACLGIITK